MAYYMRALLREWKPRPLDELVAFSEEYGYPLRVRTVAEAPPRDPDSIEAELVGLNGSEPVAVEVALDEGMPDCLLREEVEEFRAELDDAVASADAKRKVRDHLDGTRAIVAVRVPASDSEEGLAAANTVLAYFKQRPGVMVQADGEGFYVGDDLIVETG